MGLSIAIIGLAGRFPASDDVEELWDNLIAGRDCISRFTPDELAAAKVRASVREHPGFVPAEPRIPGHDMFDAELFGMTPEQASRADPQLRLFLECSHAALENAGYDPFEVPGTVAVFGSVGTPDYLPEHPRRIRHSGDDGPVDGLSLADRACAEVAHRLRLTGPAITVLTGGSSSLVGVHLGARALAAGECDLAVAGGARVEVAEPYGYFYAEGGVRSRDGRVRAFDLAGSGTVLGSAAGAVVLKRLADAVADGDHVYAIIRGSAVGGHGAACIRAALRVAGIPPSRLSYVEAHATGVPRDDAAELSAIEQAWRSLEPDVGRTCPIGSIKSNIGHPVQAAGVASLIKLTLAMDRQTIPPSINVSEPLPQLLADGYPLKVVREPRKWPRTDSPRCAAVSSFAAGAGATHAHLVLEEAPATAPTPPTGQERVVVWSARNSPAAEQLAVKLARHLSATPAYEDAITTLAVGRTAFSVRRAAVLAGPGDIAALLGEAPERPRVSANVPADGTAPVFAFPGEGALIPGGLIELYAKVPRFAANLDSAFALFRSRGKALAELWRNPREAAEVTRAGNAQPILFALELALATTLTAWGIRPAAVTGYGLGELAAATVAGVFDPADAARAVLAHADATQRMPDGAQAAVTASEAEVARLLPAELDICAVHGESETVVGGPPNAVAAFVRKLRDDGIRALSLRVSRALNTPGMRAARDEMLAVFDGLPRRRPQVPLISAAAGRRVDEEVLRPAFWADQLTTPIRFGAAVDALAGLDADRGRQRRLVVVETGPGEVLTPLVLSGAAARNADVVAVAATGRSRRGAQRRGLLTTVATAWANGVDVDWQTVFPDVPRRHVPVPGYCYQRRSYRVDIPIWNAVEEPAPDIAPATVADGLRQNALERMRALWAEVLDLGGTTPDIEPEDDFFAVGGTSMSAVKLVTRIQEEFGTTISIEQLLSTPTMSELAAAAVSESPQ